MRSTGTYYFPVFVFRHFGRSGCGMVANAAGQAQSSHGRVAGRRADAGVLDSTVRSLGAGSHSRPRWPTSGTQHANRNTSREDWRGRGVNACRTLSEGSGRGSRARSRRSDEPVGVSCRKRNAAHAAPAFLQFDSFQTPFSCRRVARSTSSLPSL